MSNIQKYAAYFHDGSVIDIQHIGDEITLSLESSEMDVEEMHDNLQFSERNTLMGKLHIKKTQSIQVDDITFSEKLKMKYDSANIFDLDISENVVKLAISWENFPPNPPVNDFSTIVITAKEIFWENIPDLYDPYW